MNLYKKEYRKLLSDYKYVSKLLIVCVTALVILSVVLMVLVNQNNSLNAKLKETRVELTHTQEEYDNMSNKYDNLLNKYTHVKLELQYQDQSKLNKVITELNKIYYLDDIPLTMNQQRYIHKISDKYNLDYQMIMGLIDLESQFKMNAINYNTNGTRDFGIFQVNSANEKWLEKELGRDLNLMNFKDNVDAGMWILNHYRDDNIYKWLTQYNKGKGGTRSYYNKYLTYKSQYAKMVLQRSERYENEY